MGHGRSLVTALAFLACALPGWAQSAALAQKAPAAQVSALVREQAHLSVPSTITFSVTDRFTTAAVDAPVSVSSIVLASDTERMRISLMAASEMLESSTGPSDVPVSLISWSAGQWNRATGSAGTLSATEFRRVAESDPGVSRCDTAGLRFTLSAPPGDRVPERYTVHLIWKVEAVGS